MNIKINCHSSICIDNEFYFDPFDVEASPQNAKVIFITHSHFDHLDIKSIKKVMNDKTIFVCTEDSKKILEKNFKNKIVLVRPNMSGEVLGVKYETFPAYNFGHHHFKELGFVGYTVTIDGTRYTICGDTDLTEELANIKTDVLLVPIGGTFTMDAQDGARLANIIKPKLVIVTHYNHIEGTADKSAEKEFLKYLDKNIPHEFLIK